MKALEQGAFAIARANKGGEEERGRRRAGLKEHLQACTPQKARVSLKFDADRAELAQAGALDAGKRIKSVKMSLGSFPARTTFPQLQQKFLKGEKGCGRRVARNTNCPTLSRAAERMQSRSTSGQGASSLVDIQPPFSFPAVLNGPRCAKPATRYSDLQFRRVACNVSMYHVSQFTLYISAPVVRVHESNLSRPLLQRGARQSCTDTWPSGKQVAHLPNGVSRCMRAR